VSDQRTGANALVPIWQVLAGLPLARAVAGRLDDPAWPSAADAALARWELSTRLRSVTRDSSGVASPRQDELFGAR
jgi:hypothetical protein